MIEPQRYLQLLRVVGVLTRVSAHSMYSHKNPHSHCVTIRMTVSQSSVPYNIGYA